MGTARHLTARAAAIAVGLATVAVGGWGTGVSAGPSHPPARAGTAGERSPLADFDGDGAQDLAIGAPSEDYHAVADSGVVNLVYGTPGAGLTSTGSLVLAQGQAAVGDTNEGGDRFGSAIAYGDVNADGFDDLAVGAPGERVDNVANAGQVHVLYGSAGGLSGERGPLTLNESYLFEFSGGFAQTGGGFGRSVAIGDLDGDGYDDLAIGSPDSFGPVPGPGRVAVVYGSAAGLVGGGRAPQSFDQSSPLVGSDPEDGDFFGSTLAIGDFDGSGIADLAVGVPGESVGSVYRAGAVNILLGGPTGLDGHGQLFHQGVAGVVSDPEIDDFFAASLSAGDVGGGDADDLVIGVPGESVGTIRAAGAINVLFGGSGGLSGPGSTLFHQDVAGIVSEAEDRDLFGTATTVGDVNGDGTDDVVVGVPGESAGAILDAGAVNVLFGGAAGPSGTGSTLFHQGSAGVVSDPEQSDRFGSALAGGDFDADGDIDLAVGVPNESVGTIAQAGAVNVLPGTPTGVTGTGSTLFHQDVVGPGGAAEQGDGAGASLGAGGS